MDGPRDYHIVSEVRENQISCGYHLYVESKRRYKLTYLQNTENKTDRK